MGGSAQYRLAKKIRNLRLMGGHPDDIKELERQLDELKQGRKSNSPYSENYSQERLNDALYAGVGEEEAVDDLLRNHTGKWWTGLPDDEKKAAYDFTGNYYDYMNEALGGVTPPEDIKDENVERINNLTSALEKSEIPIDMWVRRGVSASHIGRMVGLDRETSNDDKDLVVSLMQDAINNNKIIDIKNFMSTAATAGAGFMGAFEMKIFIPKGAKGVYAEPFSSHGGGDEGKLWDGQSEQTYFGGEFEVLLQRGYKLKPIEINRGGGRSGADQIVFTIVGQDTKPYKKPEVK